VLLQQVYEATTSITRSRIINSRWLMLRLALTHVTWRLLQHVLLLLLLALVEEFQHVFAVVSRTQIMADSLRL
jgi:hypothetical protein